MSNPTPGWYPDPSNGSQQRYWDGQQWTQQVQASNAPFGGGGGPVQFGQPAGQYGGGFQPVGESDATPALVLAILGLVCCGPAAIYSVVQGRSAKQEATATGRPLSGTMNAAYIIGIIAVVLWAIGIAVYVAVLAAAAGSN